MLNWLKKQLSSAPQEKTVQAVEIKTAESGQLAANLKAQGDALLKQGKPGEAQHCYEQAISVDPNDATTYNQLGDLYYERRELKVAETYYRQAVTLQPGFVNALLNLGLTLDESGQLPEAESCYRQIIVIKPDEALAHYNLSVTLTSQARTQEAIACCRQALILKPKFSQAYFQLASLLGAQGAMGEAETALRQAIESDPQFIQARWALANLLQQQNRLDEAAQSYREIVAIAPQLDQARNALLSILFSRQQYSEAESIYQKMCLDKPDDAYAQNNLGVALKEQNKLADAEICFKLAIQLRPDFAEAYCNLGMIQLHNNQLSDAAISYQKAIDNKPGSVDTYPALAKILIRLNRADEARNLLLQALELDDKFASAHFELGLLYDEQGELAKAETEFRKTVELMPGHAMAHGYMGVLFMNQGRYQEAETSLRRCIKEQPDEAVAHDNLGMVFYLQNRYAEAIDHFKQALELNPAMQNSWNNLGSTYNRLSQWSEAETCYCKALKIDPKSALTHNNLAKIYVKQREFSKAEASLRSALEGKPDGFGDAYTNLGNILCDTGRHKEALTSYRTAIARDPDYLEAHCNLLLQLCFGDCNSPTEYRADVLDYHHKLAKRITPYTTWKISPQPGQKLRVGMVSADLGDHPVGHFLENVLKHFDFKQMEFVAFSNKNRNDSVNSRLRQYFSSWHSIENMSDSAAAEMIHEQGIDILIDLAGQTADNRLPLFAWKPAPVQCSWLGYFGTTGVPGMDYVLADHISVPEQHEEYFSEKIWYLPETRLCFTPPAMQAGLEVAANPLPALRNTYITFACFQSTGKLNDFTLALWAEVMQNLPEARLRLQSRQLESAEARLLILERLRQFGIAPERVELHRPSSREAYLAAHKQVDMILDTFPYEGGTTTCEALWMGIPTLTLTGTTMASRQGASLLSYAGLNDWIAKDRSEFVTLAIAHASDLDKLATLRKNLRDQVLASPLFDAPRFSRNMQDALTGMWSAFTHKS
ncbi:tetratricopeptide repeat protein [Undibacterium sp. JH2W]|uniref:tetratricopeptide repeat protein n=1 Tax=Undibacterium sp. JH2W TaxID=3413037 RepID=UPI003BF27ECB